MHVLAAFCRLSKLEVEDTLNGILTPNLPSRCVPKESFYCYQIEATQSTTEGWSSHARMLMLHDVVALMEGADRLKAPIENVSMQVWKQVRMIHTSRDRCPHHHHR